MNNKTRIRTIQQCLNEIKSLDPCTAITENFIRTLCKTNQVKHFKSGTKYLVNLDNLLSYLNYTQGILIMINTLYLDSNNVIKYHNYIFHFKVVTHTLLLLMG